MTEKNTCSSTRGLVALLTLALIIALIGGISAPRPVLAQGTAPAAASLPASTTPAAVSLLLLVIGIVALGLVAVKVTGLPAPGVRSQTAPVPDDDELIQDQ